MSHMQNKRRKSRLNALIYGAASIGLYAAVFAYSDQVVSFIAKGGVRALVPVSAVFLFSWVHGSFASNVWTALGIEASQKTQREQVQKKDRAGKVSRPQASMRA